MVTFYVTFMDKPNKMSKSMIVSPNDGLRSKKQNALVRDQ